MYGIKALCFLKVALQTLPIAYHHNTSKTGKLNCGGETRFLFTYPGFNLLYSFWERTKVQPVAYHLVLLQKYSWRGKGYLELQMC